MPNLQGFQIEFDRAGAVYEPGETVNGKVVFSLAEPKNVREITLKINGKARIHWPQKGGHAFVIEGSNVNHYRREEHYLDLVNKLVGNETGQTTLLAGQHSYPFSCQLPVNIPCSFEHEYGYIRYTAEAILVRPWKFDHEIHSHFVVLAPYDLSIQQKFASPIDDAFEEKFLDLFCFDAGVMKINVSSEKRGFNPADTIELMIKYDNSLTRIDITSMKLKLTKHVIFTSRYQKQIKTAVLEEVDQTGPFGKNGEIIMKLKVPPVFPSNLKFCSIIDKEYELALTINVSGMHLNVTRSYLVQLWDTVPVR